MPSVLVFLIIAVNSLLRSAGLCRPLAGNFSQYQTAQGMIAHFFLLEGWQGWLYLAAVMDLASRRIVGWSMQRTMHRDLVIGNGKYD